jgi:hypothetical protein
MYSTAVQQIACLLPWRPQNYLLASTYACRPASGILHNSLPHVLFEPGAAQSRFFLEQILYFTDLRDQHALTMIVKPVRVIGGVLHTSSPSEAIPAQSGMMAAVLHVSYLQNCTPLRQTRILIAPVIKGKRSKSRPVTA